MTDLANHLYNVPDMSCDHCVQSITKEVSAVAGVTDLTVDLTAKTVAVSGGDDGALIAAIDEAGFDVV